MGKNRTVHKNESSLSKTEEMKKEDKIRKLTLMLEDNLSIKSFLIYIKQIELMLKRTETLTKLITIFK